MKILIVEDDTAKLQKILTCLTSLVAIALSDIDDVRDGLSAREQLKHSKYDLLIIDIAIPDRRDREAQANGGVELLEDIAEQSDYIVPDHIIGLSAFEELVQASHEVFARRDWHVIHYDPASEAWQMQIKAKAEHLIAATRSKQHAEPDYESDIAIVCALREPELTAIRDLPWEWQAIRTALDHVTYFKGRFTSSQGRAGIAYAAAAPKMGMAPAAALAMKMICLFRPRFVAMAGIAAGVRGEANLGDIVIADQCWDYGSGKHDTENGKPVFRIAPSPCVIDPAVRSHFDEMSTDHAWLSTVWNSWRGVRPAEHLLLRLGPMASGAAVVADSNMTASVSGQNRKLLAVEMEAYGVLSAVEQSPVPRPMGFVAKSVCDFADEAKNDRYQSYAAYTSANAIARFVERYC